MNVYLTLSGNDTTMTHVVIKQGDFLIQNNCR